MFHLGTHDAKRKLIVRFANTLITHFDHPKYIGMTLDRTLLYKAHLEKTGMKLNFRVNLFQKLSSTYSGSGAHTLRTACIVLVYSTAEYCLTK
jgi:hypothetical protein